MMERFYPSANFQIDSTYGSIHLQHIYWMCNKHNESLWYVVPICSINDITENSWKLQIAFQLPRIFKGDLDLLLYLTTDVLYADR